MTRRIDMDNHELAVKIYEGERDFSGIKLNATNRLALIAGKQMPMTYTDYKLIEKSLSKELDNVPDRLYPPKVDHLIFRGSELNSLDLDGVNFEGANFEDCEIYYSDFSHANFKNANLKGLETHGCKFRSTDFEGANFERAMLSSDFEGANFEGANFKKTVFLYSNLARAKIGKRDIERIKRINKLYGRFHPSLNLDEVMALEV